MRLPIILLILTIILILLVLRFIIYLFRSSGKSAPEAVQEKAAVQEKESFQMGKAAAESTPLSIFSASQLKTVFAQAEIWLKTHVSGKDFRYQIPRFLMIGESTSGKTTTLKQSRLRYSATIPDLSEGEYEKQPCNFWFFERGVIADIAGDLVLNENGDEKLWDNLLKLLRKYRPKRPIDGVILTIPCSGLMASDDEIPNVHIFNRIAKKADILYAKLWQAQKILGMRFPLYFLVTGCESIKGFENFCNEIPQQARDHIFGWSVPYPADSAYSQHWVSEAFQHTDSVLARMQLEMFAQGTAPENRDGLFLFPGNFSSLAEPLQVWLDHLFRQSAYHEMFMLRGIYFCGQGAFVKDLVEQKIFPESALARPLKQAMISGNRKLLAAQAAAAAFFLIASLGLWSDAYDLNIDRKRLEPFLETLDDDIDNLNVKAFEGKSDPEFYKLMQTKRLLFEKSAKNLISGISEVRSLRYGFIPASWFSGIHSNIEKAMTGAYNEIILKGAYINLIHKIRTVFETLKTPPSDSPANYKPFSIEQTPEFVNLRKFADQITEFELYALTYNTLNVSADVKDLGKLIEYLHKTQLPAEFYSDDEYHRNALKDAKLKKFDISAYKQKTNELTLKPLINRIFTSNTLLQHLKTLSLQMESFAQKSRTHEDEQLIRDLTDMISKTEAVLERPEQNWMFKEKPDFGKPFNELMDDIEQSQFFGPESRKKLESEVKTAFYSFREELRSQRSSLTGPLLKREGGTMTNMLSPPVLQLKSDMKKLLNQKFMVLEKDGDSDIVIPSGMKLTWSIEPLEDAVRLFDPYEGFINSGLKNFPKDMRHVISNLARRNLAQNLLDRVSKAQQIKPGARGGESELGAEIRNFKEASKYLGRLLIYSEQLDLTESYQMLSEVIFRQAGRLLENTDGLLVKEDLYRNKGKDFSWWDGKEKLSLAAFGAADQKELEYFLKVQRERVKYIAYEYAEPLLSFFSTHKLLKNRKEEHLMFKWERILAEFEKYQTKQPENSIAALEQFILFDMDSIKPEEYSTKIKAKDIHQRSSDLFLQKRNELMAKLYYRCQKMTTDNVFTKYNEIKSFFDAKLSGRFPFMIIRGQQSFVEAKPEDIRNFYRIFDKIAPDAVNLLKSGDQFGLSGESARTFLTRMTDIRQIFAPYLDKDKKDAKPPGDKTDEKKEEVLAPDIPAFDIDVEFRVNQEHEAMANRIIDWRLTVGGQSFRYGDALRTGQWRFGDPISFTLRWAKDGADYPVFAGDQAEADETEKIITYRFKQQWALLYFLRHHAGDIEDFGQSSDPKPHTLKFSIDTRRSGMEPQEEGKFTTKAYIRITVMTPGKIKTLLTLPYFPDNAPELKIEKAD